MGWRPLRPGEVLAVAHIAAGLLTSAELARRGEDSMCECVRTNRLLWAGVATLALHSLTRMPYDPWRWTGMQVVRVTVRR